MPYKFESGTIIVDANISHIINKSQIIFKQKNKKIPFEIQEGKSFPITDALNKNFDVSLDLVFEGGSFESSTIATKTFFKLINILPVLNLFLLILYSYILWNKYGKDPKGPFVTEYAPPKNVTPAFAKYILNRREPPNFYYFIITLISLVMKKYIKITEVKGQVFVTSLKGSDSSDLVEEDKIIYDSLFAYSPEIVLDNRNAVYIYNAISALFNRLETKREQFFTHNIWYTMIPNCLLLVSIGLPFAFSGAMRGFAIICFFIAVVVYACFLATIDNVAPQYQKLYCQIMGFKQYLEIAESGRIALSNPFDKERLFCDYLPYAYAFGIGKGLIKMFPAQFDWSLVASVNFIARDKTNIMLNDIMGFYSKKYLGMNPKFSIIDDILKGINR